MQVIWASLVVPAWFCLEVVPWPRTPVSCPPLSDQWSPGRRCDRTMESPHLRYTDTRPSLAWAAIRHGSCRNLVFILYTSLLFDSPLTTDKVEFGRTFNNNQTFRHLIYSINLSSNILEEFYCRQSFLLLRCEKSCQWKFQRAQRRPLREGSLTALAMSCRVLTSRVQRGGGAGAGLCQQPAAALPPASHLLQRLPAPRRPPAAAHRADLRLQGAWVPGSKLPETAVNRCYFVT